MFQHRRSQSTSKYRNRKSRRLVNRVFIFIIAVLLATFAFASGGLLTWKQIVPPARAQSDKPQTTTGATLRALY